MSAKKAVAAKKPVAKKPVTKKAVTKKVIAKKPVEQKAVSQPASAPSEEQAAVFVPAPGEKFTVLHFTFDEHAWPEDAWDDTTEAYTQAARENPWKNLGEMEWDDTRDYRTRRLVSLETIREDLVNAFADAESLPVELMASPLDRVAEVMAREGLEYVTGVFIDFEGNHCDTEIGLVTRKVR